VFQTWNEIEVNITSFAESSAEVIGDQRRSWSGKHRQSIEGEVRKWSGTLEPMTLAGYETLRNMTKLGTHISVAGPSMPGAPRICVINLSGAPYLRDGLDFVVEPSFDMESVDPDN
jgi:hypothetical protein